MNDLFCLPEGGLTGFSHSEKVIDLVVYLSGSSTGNLAVSCFDISGMLLKLIAENTFESDEGVTLVTIKGFVTLY